MKHWFYINSTEVKEHSVRFSGKDWKVANQSKSSSSLEEKQIQRGGFLLFSPIYM